MRDKRIYGAMLGRFTIELHARSLDDFAELGDFSSILVSSAVGAANSWRQAVDVASIFNSPRPIK